jgi:hypothetical protein
VPIKGIPGSWACVPGKIAAEITAYPLVEDADRVQPPRVIRVRAGASRRREWSGAGQWASGARTGRSGPRVSEGARRERSRGNRRGEEGKESEGADRRALLVRGTTRTWMRGAGLAGRVACWAGRHGCGPRAGSGPGREGDEGRRVGPRRKWAAGRGSGWARVEVGWAAMGSSPFLFLFPLFYFN